MDLAQARQVLWLSNYPRPLGELFDEGYLDRARLTWAVSKAHNPQLREAAKALLGMLPAGTQAPAIGGGSTAKSFDPGISLQQARAKPWPFGQHKSQPMGQLVASKQLSLKDLAYAVETAWDDGVRKAAMALMLERLDQILKEPPPSTGLLEVVSGGRSYAAQRETWFTFLQGGLMGLLLSGMVAIVVGQIRYWSTPHAPGKTLAEVLSSPTQTIAFFIFLLLAVLFTWYVIRLPEIADKRLQKSVDEARRGQEGEQRVVDTILQALNGSWKIFRNARVPGARRGDVDLILVGPPGVWALEVKNLQGEYRNIGDTWEYRHGKTWRRSSAQPSQEARKHAAGLGGFLKADGIQVFVEPAVVWANPESLVSVEHPSVPVWTLDRLPDELGNISYSKQMPVAMKEKIMAKLTDLCARQRTQLTEKEGAH
jgi:hypothetical protein